MTRSQISAPQVAGMSAVARMAPEGFQPGGVQAREMRFAPASYNRDSRTVEAVFAAGAAVQRFGYIETVAMTPDAGDLSRVNSGQCRLLDSHNAYEIDAILGIVEAARFESGQLVGTLRFANTPRGHQAESMAAEGVLTGLSIGYSVQTWTNTAVENDIEAWRADKWTLLEVTLCAVPADAAASVRSYPPLLPLETDMTRSLTPAPTPVGDPAPAGATPAAPIAPGEVRSAPVQPTLGTPAAPALAEVIAPVELRATAPDGIEILALLRQGEFFGQRALVETLIASGASADSIRRSMMDRAAEKQANNLTLGGPTIHITRDEGDTRRAAVSNSILLRANPSAIDKATPEGRAAIEQARAYRGMTLLECFRAFAEEEGGVKLRNFSKLELAGLALGVAGPDVRARAQLGSSDFPNLLANIAAKRLRDTYGSIVQPWRAFCRQSNATDFKQKAVVALSGLPDFRLVREGQEFEYSAMSDSVEKYSLATYGRVIPITRQALINDDLGAFDRLPTFLGRAAAELENTTVWNILLANAAMADGVGLFHASHSNLGTAGDISEASIAEIEQKMGEQLDASGVTPLNLRPMFLVVTPKRKVAAQKLLSAVQATQTSGVNVYQNSMTLIVEARLKPKTGVEPWFVIGDPAQLDTVEYAYLDGQEGVYTEQRIGFEIDGIEIKGRLDFAAKAIDWRNMAKNPGV